MAFSAMLVRGALLLTCTAAQSHTTLSSQFCLQGLSDPTAMAAKLDLGAWEMAQVLVSLPGPVAGQKCPQGRA